MENRAPTLHDLAFATAATWAQARAATAESADPGKFGANVRSCYNAVLGNDTKPEVEPAAKETTAGKSRPEQQPSPSGQTNAAAAGKAANPASTRRTVAAETAGAPAGKVEPSGDTPTGADAPSAQEAAGVSFATARDLVLKLAKAGHREAIQAINAQYGIAKLSALLSDPEDFDSVTDQAKLDAVYADLVAIEG